MINLDEEENILALNGVLERNSRRGLRKLVKLELTKSEKFENRILCLCDYRFILVTITKNNRPGKIDSIFHFFDVKKLESLSHNQLTVTTNDNKEFKMHAFEACNSVSESELENGFDSIVANIDEILSYYCSNLFDVFPSVTIKELIDLVNIQPEKRLNSIYKDINELKSLRNKLNLCDSYSKAYAVCCDYYSVLFYQEVVWDVNVIYGKNCVNEFSINDFDYVNIKDFYPLIWALRHNKWFESLHSEGNKLTNEIQEELTKILVLQNCNLKKLTLIQANLKPEFFNKLQNQFSQFKHKHSSQILPISNPITNLKSINLSRNPIEDRGLMAFINLFKDQQSSSTHSNLIDISLSKCSITSKSINNLFSTINLYLLNTLDLSHNNLKEEPTDFFKYLAEPNQLIELNLTNTDIDIDKLFVSLSKGGCDTSLKKLILNNNHSFSKLTLNENNNKYLTKTKALIHLEISYCKLSSILVQTILSSLKNNPNLCSNGIHLNLSSNDIGSNIRHFMHEFNNNYTINSLDLSECNLDVDSDILISQMYQTNIKSLALNRNFQNSKAKVVSRFMQSLIKWLISKTNSLEELWLIDCRFKSGLNDFISEMGEFTKLKLLDISGNDVGDLCINVLSKSLQVNRSLETLIIDRSNISLSSYQRILDSLERNFTLKTIQMPINDICILYQKSPDKVVDIVKQMTDALAHRNLINMQKKCDLNQLFKSKMKLINETNQLVHHQPTLNVSIGSLSSNSSSNHSPNRMCKSNENEADSESLNENSNDSNLGQSYPSSIKEVLQCLNESACNYLSQNSIEKQYKKLNEDIFSKLDDIVDDLEKELVNKLKKSYPKYSNSIQLNSNQSNTQPNNNPKNYSIGPDLTRLKSTIREYTNSMIVQIHNEICEMSYNLSLSMSEKIMHEAQQSKPILSEKKTPAPLESVRSNSMSNESTSNSENVGKKIIGGIKLPFGNLSLANSPLSDLNHTPNSVQQRVELMNNSKTKRPISSQIYDTPVISQQNEANNHSLSPTKHFSSSSNENLIENSSDDDLLNETRSREKTPDSLISDETSKTSKTPIEFLVNSISSNPKKETPEVPVPIPAPRKTKNLVKSLLGNLGVGQVVQKITSPKTTRKFADENKEPEIITSNEIKTEESAENDDSIRPLQHINKSRPRRANVKRPTVKNPYTNIETDLPPVDIVDDNLKNSNSLDNEISIEQSNEKTKSTSPIASASNIATTCPNIPKVPNQVEQPKISLGILENVKLRKTVRNKQLNEESQNAQNNDPAEASQTSSFVGNSNKLVNRLSMFETKPDAKNDVKKFKKPSEEISEIAEENESNKSSKPLPPIPPVKPPRPVFNPGKSTEPTIPAANLVKLRPVSSMNGSTSISTNNSNTNNKVNDSNGIKLNSNSNSTGTTSSSSISSNSTSSVTDAKLITNSEIDKRTSVKDIVQMWSDESKA